LRFSAFQALAVFLLYLRYDYASLRNTADVKDLKMIYERLNLQEFMAKYSTDEACLQAIISNRWPDGFLCPKCGSKSGNRLKCRRAFQCTACGSQTSITANTVFHQAKLSLTKWFLAIYFLAANKQGISSVSLGKHIGCSFQTAWHMLHKFRYAMKERDVQYVLHGNVIIDEAYIGSTASGSKAQGRSTETKSAVLVAVEEKGDDTTGYIHLQPIHHASSTCILPIIKKKVDLDATIKTDGWGAYNGLTELGFEHNQEKSKGGKEASLQFPLVHRAIANLKTWMMGTFKNFCQTHLDLYTAEFSYRANRRNRSGEDRQGNLREATLAERLIGATSLGGWVSWKQVIERKHQTAAC
jgi:transposase-like protein